MHLFVDISATSTVPWTCVILYQLIFNLHLVSNKGTAKAGTMDTANSDHPPLLQRRPNSVRQQTLRSTTLTAASCQQSRRTSLYQPYKAEKTQSISKIQ